MSIKSNRLYGWWKHSIAVGIVSGVLFLAPVQTFADATSDTTATPTTTPDSSVIAGGSTASTTDTTSIAAAQDQTTTPDPNQIITQPSSVPTDTTNAAIIQTDTGTAVTGDATVSQNQTGGDASTGPALSTTTLVNIIQSAGDPTNPIQSFTDTITGNQTGDITIDPATLQNLLLQNGNQSQVSTILNYLTNATITNNVNLSATSGNATVDSNGVGGNATTGSASTNANLLNLINSSISDQQTFLGIINILGNLNGNIVIPQSLLNALMAQGTTVGAGTTPSQITNNYVVNNQLNLSAQSGNASVINNGLGGNATSGNASTNIQQYNLINSQIGGGNVLLVFVNVLGVWNGYLLNNPLGVTSALVGNGIQNASINPSIVGSSTTNETINNNVTLSSTSGNALVSNNGVGGNASTGNASSSANIVNILGAQINLTGWFGVLFINVFGSWNGSLIASAPIVVPVTIDTPQSSPSPDESIATTQVHQHRYAGIYHQPNNIPTTFASTFDAQLLGKLLSPILHGSKKTTDSSDSRSISPQILASVLIFIAIVLLVIDRVIAQKRLVQN